MINKEDFIKYFTPIVEYLDEYDKVNDALQTIFNSSYCTIPDFSSRLLDSYIKLLETMCNDNNQWISYFVWDCELGKKNNKITINNVDTKLNTVDDLYNIIFNLVL